MHELVQRMGKQGQERIHADLWHRPGEVRRQLGILVKSFGDWKVEHGRRYVVGSQEEMFRMKIWMDNKIKIEKHNKLFHEVRV